MNGLISVKCERCLAKPADARNGRFCDRCYMLLEIELKYDREHREYLNAFCQRAKAEAELQARREKLADPLRSSKTTIEVELIPDPKLLTDGHVPS